MLSDTDLFACLQILHSLLLGLQIRRRRGLQISLDLLDHPLSQAQLAH
jgi:hypothetical protein